MANTSLSPLGGAPKHPLWYFNALANSTVEIQDGATKQDMTARELTGAEREEWWKRAVDAFPPYADYRGKPAGSSPILLCETGVNLPAQALLTITAAR